MHRGLAHFKPPRPSLSPRFEPPLSRAPLGHPLSPLRALLSPPRPGHPRCGPGPTQAPIASPLPLNAREDTQGTKDPPPRTRPSSPCLPCPARISPEHRPPWPWPHSPSSSVGRADRGERARRSPPSSPVRRAPAAAPLVAGDELGLAPSVPAAREAVRGRRRPAGGPATPPVSLCRRVQPDPLGLSGGGIRGNRLPGREAYSPNTPSASPCRPRGRAAGPAHGYLSPVRRIRVMPYISFYSFPVSF